MIIDDLTPAPSLGMDDVRAAVIAAAKAYGVNAFVIVGRASLAVTMPHADPLLRATMDIDLFPPWDETKAAVWAAADLSVGRLSEFRREHGFYVERVAEWTTSQLPPGWGSRSTNFEVDGVQVKAIHPHDLICAKLIAGRSKDFAFIRSALELQLTTIADFEAFVLQNVDDDASQKTLCRLLRTAEKYQEEPC